MYYIGLDVHKKAISYCVKDIVTDEVGEIYLCNARCFCVWSMTLATKPEITEELKGERLKLNTPNSDELQFGSIVELVRWAGANALQTTLVRTPR